MQLDFWIIIGSSTDSTFKCACSFYYFYADVTIYGFCDKKISITVTQEVTRVVKHSGRAYRQGTRTCQIQRRMKIFAIGWEVRFSQHFRSYREFMRLNLCMLLLWYHYVIVYAYYKPIVILQRSLQRSCVTLLLCFYAYFILWCYYGSQYILCFYEGKLSSYCYNFTRKHIFDGLITVLSFFKHMNVLF